MIIDMVSEMNLTLRVTVADRGFQQIKGRGANVKFSELNLKCTIRTQLISATRGRASQPEVLAMATDCSATCQQG